MCARNTEILSVNPALAPLERVVSACITRLMMMPASRMLGCKGCCTCSGFDHPRVVSTCVCVCTGALCDIMHVRWTWCCPTTQ